MAHLLTVFRYVMYSSSVHKKSANCACIADCLPVAVVTTVRRYRNSIIITVIKLLFLFNSNGFPPLANCLTVTRLIMNIQNLLCLFSRLNSADVRLWTTKSTRSIQRRKPPARQLIPQNSNNCPCPAVERNPLKFMDPVQNHFSTVCC